MVESHLQRPLSLSLAYSPHLGPAPSSSLAGLGARVGCTLRGTLYTFLPTVSIIKLFPEMPNRNGKQTFCGVRKILSETGLSLSGHFFPVQTADWLYFPLIATKTRVDLLSHSTPQLHNSTETC